MGVTTVIDELVDFLTPEEARELDEHLAALAEPAIVARATGRYPVPDDWRTRLKAVFPKHVQHPFADRHVAFWDHVDAITPEASPDPFVAVWPRGGGKSTGAELAVADLGCRDRRRYCLYVRETQLQADKSVQNIAALLESREVADHYPHHADRKVGKYGTSKGWNRERLTTAGGFVVDAVGLDTATRGLKFEEQRPDLIVFDDIDGKLDGPHITAKKEAILTHSILPAGATNCAVLFVQNLIIPDGICSKLADGRADYLARRRVSGPFPAVEGLQYEWRTDSATGIRRAVITHGTATWAGQPLAACQHAIDSWGLQAFLKEAQHQVTGRAEGVALRFDAGRHLVDLTDAEAAQLVQRGLQSRGLSVFGGIDFGAWRFGFTLWVVTPAGIVTRVDEYFAQRLPGEASLTDRAKAIHAVCESYGIPVTERTIPIWGDAANPTDILELNLAFRNGWVDERGQTVTSRLRVVPVAGEHKARKTSVDRLNNLLDRNALQFRRGVRYEWRYGMNAGHEGTPQVSSRLLWEMENWAYPIPRPGMEQGQDPDDATADGADCVASMRYAIMSWWSPTRVPAHLTHYADDKAPPFDLRKQRFQPVPHAADLLTAGTRTPAVRMPRPRTSR